VVVSPPIEVLVRRFRPAPPGEEELPLPQPATTGSSGLDLRADLESPLLLPPGGRAAVPTGLALTIPPGHEGQVRPRSGLALQHGLTVLNAPGTIDADYRGEVKVILVNLGSETVTISRGMRIAQLVLSAVASPLLVEVHELPTSERGAGGFGHTGK